MATNGGNGANNGGRAGGPRCVALVGPFQSGKTTLLEAILARTDAKAQSKRATRSATPARRRATTT
jgi:translation elongation factor EF-G